MKSGAPATFHMARSTGSAIRNALVDAMIAGGFPSARGLGNEVSLSVRMTLTMRSN